MLLTAAIRRDTNASRQVRKRQIPQSIHNLIRIVSERPKSGFLRSCALILLFTFNIKYLTMHNLVNLSFDFGFSVRDCFYIALT